MAHLGPASRIIGIDIDPSCKAHEAEGIEIHIGSQDDTALLDRIVAQHPQIDIVLDDGSHMMRHMLATLRHLYPRMAATGVYVVEDVGTSYWDEYEGGLKPPGTFIEHVKDLIDSLNASGLTQSISVAHKFRLFPAANIGAMLLTR